MIPFLYRLRKGVRFENQGDCWIVISETPLNVVRASARATEMLRLCNGQRTVEEIAHSMGVTGEHVFKICDYFNKKAVLEIMPAESETHFPTVTIIIPVKDRAHELAECLQSVVNQDYQKDRMELIVVDDGSEDKTAEVARSFPCTLLTNKRTRGQSFCRNLAAAEAHGEILAFIDSDCVASSMWIRQLVTYFRWARVGAVGGYVDGYYEQSGLDRYEKACSSLNMGKHILFSTDDRSTFYVPTCNLLIRKDIYLENGGITESLHVGEDVDLCWRMRSRGHTLIYVPTGVVLHKHRNGIAQMLKRRADYGTSEALLYGLHREKRKTFQTPPSAAIAFLALCFAVLFCSVMPVLVAAACAATETGMKTWRMTKAGLNVSVWRILYSVIRTHLSFLFFASFHIVRYYLLCLLVAGMVLPVFWALGLAMLAYAALVDYVIKRPKLFFGAFLLYYTLEHLCYQAGVAVGCVRARTFSPYRSTFKRGFAFNSLF
jgi:mycofactocin glycosyltransferase